MRKKGIADSKPNKQMTLDSLPEELLEKPKSLSSLKEEPKKQITISNIGLD